MGRWQRQRNSGSKGEKKAACSALFFCYSAATQGRAQPTGRITRQPYRTDTMIRTVGRVAGHAATCVSTKPAQMRGIIPLVSAVVQQPMAAVASALQYRGKHAAAAATSRGRVDDRGWNGCDAQVLDGRLALLRSVAARTHMLSEAPRCAGRPNCAGRIKPTAGASGWCG